MSKSSNKIKVGFSIGDPNGIGIEIILKTLDNKNILELFTPIIFASTKLLTHQKNIFNKKQLFLQGIFKEEDAVDGKINVLNLWKDFSALEFGKPGEEVQPGFLAVLSKESPQITPPVERPNSNWPTWMRHWNRR